MLKEEKKPTSTDDFKIARYIPGEGSPPSAPWGGLGPWSLPSGGVASVNKMEQI